MRKYQLLLFVFAVCIRVTPANELPAAKVLADAPAFSLPPKELQRLADQSVSGAKAAAVILIDDEHWTFRADNSFDRQQRSIYKVIDASAIESWSSVQQRWEPWHQDRPTIRARVISSDGVSHELDPKTLVDAPAGGNSTQSYSDLRVLQGPLPAVAAGSIIETEITEHTTPVLGSMVFRGYIGWGAPVRFSRMIADYPEALPFRYTANLCPDLKESKQISNGMVHLALTFGAFEPTKQMEPLLPFDVPGTAAITMSTGTSWNDLAIRYGKVVDDRLAEAPVKDFVNKSLQGEKERSIAIQKLVQALHTEVRYTGVEFGDAAIVPAKPAETLSRKYGDCKDKAVLLVAMLRAAGIPAHIALLNAGLDQDVNPLRPGMGMFNHAIVYAPGSPDFWIDATAEHFRVGTLPPPDEGRLALIIRPDSKDLRKIPESPANANTTTLDYYLPDFGPAHIVQSVGGTGPFDSSYRDLATLLDNEEIRKRAEKETQTNWNTKAEIKFTHGSLNDFSTPFKLSTDMPGSKAVTVSETSANLLVPVGFVFSGVPQYFATDDSKDNDSADKKKPRTAGFVLPAAFVANLSLRTHIPPGFALKKTPEDQTVKLGPATYTARYVLKDQVISATLSLDSGKRNYTLEEGIAFKKALLEFAKQSAPELTFEPLGQTLLDEGRLREGLDAFRSLAAQHKAEAVNHVRLSRAYLAADCGREAREEAKAANQIAPGLPVTWRNLAFVYEHDLIGRKYKEGWDPTEVETALRKVISLDPDDLSAQTELAESFSYSARGAQYQSMDRLSKAVDLYHGIGDEKLEQLGDQDVLIYNLAILGNLDDLKTKLDRFGSNGSRAGYRVFLITAREGASKAAAYLQSSASGDALKQAYLSAVSLIVRTGRYEQAADLATAMGLASDLFMPAADLRKMQHTSPGILQPDSPENLMRCYLAAPLEPGENALTLARFWSNLAAPGRVQAKLAHSQRQMLSELSQHGTAAAVARDVFLSTMKVTSESNGDSGFRVRATVGGKTAPPAFVVREGTAFKMLGDDGLFDGVARQSLTDLQEGHQDVARKWLDWLRDTIKIRSEDDPLGGPVFPHLWNKGAPASPAQIRYAAASLILSKESVPILKEAIGSTSDSVTKAFYQLAFSRVCANVKSWTECLPVAKALAVSYPGSDTALELLARSNAGAGDAQAAEQILKKAIENAPDDLALKRALVNTLAEAKRLKDAVQAAKESAETPNSTALDWNLYGWIALVAGSTDESMIHAVERAQSQPVSAVQNTIAAMYAELGKLNEARNISLQSLDKFGYSTPDPEWWYVFGRIAEQLQANASAISYYEKVVPGPNADDPLSAYSLAQRQLNRLHH